MINRLQIGLRSTILLVTICAWYLACFRLLTLGSLAGPGLMLCTSTLLGALGAVSVASRLITLERWKFIVAVGIATAFAAIAQEFLNIAMLFRFFPVSVGIIPQFSTIALLSFVTGTMIGSLAYKYSLRLPTTNAR